MARQRAAGAPADEVKPAEGFSPTAVFGDEGPTREDDEATALRAENERLRKRLEAIDEGDDHPLRNDPALRDAKSAADEILRLREENAALRGVGGGLSGGKFTVALRDGPTATVEAKPGESAADAYMRACGIHATPHRPEVHEAADDAVCGIHLPNGTVRPFAAG